MPATVTVGTGTVDLQKPVWLSKKVWIAAIGLALVLYKGATGKPEDVIDLPQVLDKIQSVAAVLAVIVPTILAIAHVDGKERDLVAAVLNTAKTIGTSDPVVAAPPIVPPYDPTKS